MAAMSANLKLEGKVKLKNIFSGGKTFSSCVTAPNGPGELILAPSMMADVMVLHLGGGIEWIVGESCLLGSTPGVQRTTKTQGKHLLLLDRPNLMQPALGPPGTRRCMVCLVCRRLADSPRLSVVTTQAHPCVACPWISP